MFWGQPTKLLHVHVATILRASIIQAFATVYGWQDTKQAFVWSYTYTYIQMKPNAVHACTDNNNNTAHVYAIYISTALLETLRFLYMCGCQLHCYEPTCVLYMCSHTMIYIAADLAVTILPLIVAL